MSMEDDAQEVELKMWMKINQPRNTVTQIGPEHCQECGLEMNTIRRNHGFSRCVDCQTILDQKHLRNR